MQQMTIPFQHLAPTDNVDDPTTFAALDFALSQENINNIALTGTYGSGKSSILRTYEKTHRKYHFLDISLATFAVEQSANDKGDGTNGQTTIPDTTIQKIEKSILQQIFYKKMGVYYTKLE